jgi:hypothetical protein
VVGVGGGVVLEVAGPPVVAGARVVAGECGSVDAVQPADNKTAAAAAAATAESEGRRLGERRNATSFTRPPP